MTDDATIDSAMTDSATADNVTADNAMTENVMADISAMVDVSVTTNLYTIQKENENGVCSSI